MSYQRQATTAPTTVTATSGPNQTTRFNSGSSTSSSIMGLINSPNSHQSARTSTPSRLLDELLALGSRANNCQQPNLSNIEKQQHQSNITIIDYRQSQGAAPPTTSSLLFRNTGASFDGGASSKMDQQRSTFDQFASQFKASLGLGGGGGGGGGGEKRRTRPTETPPATGSNSCSSTSGAQPPPPVLLLQQPSLLTGNVKILDIRRTKTNRRRPKAADANESVAPIQLAYEDEVEDDSDGDGDGDYNNDDDASAVQLAADHQQRQQQQQQQEQSATRNRSQTLTRHSQQQQQQPHQQQQQRQQSGETLSSFESDYDLLVYLGETETEDLVETERSLDYLDQTWRQSICGGASLAPTIDESLSELLTPTGTNQQQHQNQQRFAQITPTRTTPIDYNDDFDSLWTTPGNGQGVGGQTPAETSTLSSLYRQQRANRFNQPPNQPSNLLPDYSAYGAGGQLSASLPRQQNYYRHHQDEQQQQTNRRTGGPLTSAKTVTSTSGNNASPLPLETPRQFAGPVRGGRDLQAANFSKQLAEVQASGSNNNHHSQPIIDRTQQQQQQQTGQAPNSLAGNIGNKLVSLFGRNTKHHQQQQPQHSQRDNQDSFGAASESARQEAESVRQLNELLLLNQPSVTSANTQMAPQKPRRQQYAVAGGQAGGPSSTTRQHGIMDGNADELDRLLAEMSQSLDLDSLARYDPYANAGTAASQQRRQQQQLPNNQTHQSSYAPQLPATTSSGTSMRPQQLQKQAAQTEKVTNYDKMPLQTTNRNESILDEYDGASRMLEQMISDQLDEALAGVDAPRQQQHQLPSASISTGTTGMTTSDGPDTPLATTTSTSRQLASGEPIGGASVTSSSSARAQRFKLANKQGSSSRQTTITNHSSQATSDSEERASSVSQARKISTGSSATTETSVIPMHTAKSDQTRQQQHLLSQQRQALQRSDRSSGDDFDVARVGPNKSSSSSRERILAVHHHQSSLDETPRTTKKNPSSSSAAAKRPSQHHRYPLNYSRSLDVAAETSATQKTQPADSHRLPGKAAAPLPPAAAPAPEESRRQREPSAASIKSNSSTSSSSADTEPVPPVPPAVDYSDHYPDDGEENRSVPLATRRATTTTIQSPTKDNNNLRPSRTALSATQLAAQSPDRNQGGEQVIQVEANELPSPTSSDEDESGGGGKHKRVMSRMKRRTMSGVRSMRQRLNRHFSVGPEVKQQQQQQHKASVGPSEGAGRPEPPTRSSSIGSSRSGHSPRAGSKPGESSGSPRQSRQRERRPTSGTQASESMNKRTAPDELGPAVDSGKKSFGQQWRERLSRSKSRFSQFLRPLSSHRQRQDDDEHNQEHRAQSTPNDETTGRLQLDMFQPGDIARNEQQQTGKAGSASRPTRPTADESSLERQLRADLDKIRPPPPATTTTKTITLEPLPQTEKGNVHKPSTANITRQQSQSSDRSLASGDLDGLETTTGRRNQPLFGRRSARSSKRKSRTTPAQGKKHNQLASQTQKRPASLISLKRFSESFGRSPKLNTSDTEDLDSMKVKSSGDASTSANQQNLAGSSSRPKRNSRNKRLRNKSLGDQRPLEAAGHSPTSRLDILTPARATTDDYFGLRAPLKTAASSESPPPAIGSALVHQRVEMGPRVRPASAMLPAEADTTSEGDDHETRPDRHINHKLFAKRRPRVPPNRSQSLKSVDRPSVKSPSGEQHLTLGVSGSGDGDQQALTAKDSAGTGDARQKSVSFQNLSPATANQRRPLSPVSPNTFRPVSANPATTQTLEPDYHHHQTPTGAGADAGSITPIQLAPILANASTSSSSAGAAGTSERVASSKTTPVSTSRSPIRERGAALLDDLRNKYTDLFRSHQPSNRNEVHQLRPAGAPQSTGKPVDSAEAPPSRPPRHRKRRDRNQDQHRDHIVEPRSKSLAAAPSVTVIEVEPSSPPASLLLGVGDSPEPQQHQSDGPRRGGVKRLTSFAQQLKTSAADFFSSSGQHHHHHQPGGHGEPNKKSVVAAESGPQQQAGTTVDRRALLRSLDEPLIQNDLAEWRPIIPVSTKAASSSTRRRLQRSSSFKLPKDHLDESGGDRSRTLGDERDTADKSKGLDDDDDSDSTWDSGSSDTENDNDDDKHHANRIVPTQAHGVAQRAQASRRLDDSSTAAAAVASRTIDDDEQQQVADGLMRGGTNSHNRRQHTRQAGDLPLGSSALAQTNTNTNKNTNSASHSSPNSHRIVHAAIPAVAPTSLAIGTDKNNNDEHQASGNNNNNNRNSCNSNNNGVRGSVAESTRLQPQLATQSNQKHKHQLDHLAHQAQSKQATWQQSSTSANETTTTKLSNRFVPEQDDNSSVIVANQINDGSSCNIVAPTSSKPTESQQQEQAKQQRKSRVNEQEQPAPPAYSSVNERVFKFNQNLPSPSQILSETKLTRRNQELKQQQPVESGEMTVTRSIAGVRGRSRLDEQGPRRDEAQIGQVHEQKTLANEPENDPQTDGNNRLSIYENVNPNEDIKRRQQQEETTTDQAELQYLVSKRTIAFNSDNNIQVQTEPTSEATKKDDKITTTITTNAGLKKKPEPPAKPQQKTLERALNSTKARELRADERGQQQDDWSVEPDEKLVERMILSRVPTREPPVKATDQQEKTPASAPKAVVTSSWSRRTERKLVPMTSIIHEPEDDLMNLEPSATAKSSTTSGADLERASPSPDKNKQQQQEQERDVWPPGDRRHSNMSNFSIQNDNNSDNESDSSLIGGYGRRRLENKLKKQQQQQQGSQLKKPPVPGRPPNLPRAGGDTSGGGGSLVRRLARNFDQTIKEQPASVPSALRHRSDDRAGGTGQLQQQQAVSASTATNRQQGAQETSLADEPKSDSTWYDAKSVELLDEAEVAELLREFESDGQLSNSEQYVTLSRDQTGRRDERVRGSRGQRREDGDAAGQEEEDDDDDDPTLNDDETLNDANDEENDDQRDGDDDDLLDETFGGQGEEEESVYASAATNQNMSPETSCGANSNNNKIRTEVGSRVGEFERENGRGAGVLVPAAVSASVAADRARHSRPIDHEGDDSAAADRCRRPAASNDDGGNCGDQRHREACSSGKLVVVCDDDDSDSDHDDNDAEARGHANDCSNVTPYSEASTQRTNENTLLALPQLGSNHLTNTKTQPQLDNRNREGEDYKNKQRPEQLQQPGAVDNMGPQLAVASGQTKGSAQVELERETSGGAGDKQIFSNRLLAAFQATKTTTSEAGAFETKTTTANARTTTTTTTETATDTSEDQTVNDHHHHHHHRDQDQEDASSMVGELSCSEQSSSYREDLISLSSSSLSSESMPELRQRKNLQRLYNIVNEICTSEEKFVATLKLLNESFRQHILANVNQTSGGEQGVTSSSTLTTTATNNIQQQLQPPFDCIGLILKHLPQLQALNESLLDELRQARNQWPSTQKISHVLVKIGPFLKHYSSYIRDFECIQQQFQDNLKKSAQFRDVIKRFERDHSDRCGQLSIQHHLLKPIQRIPQYRLLLQQYLHHLKPDDADYEDTVSALEVVSRVAEHANHSLSEGANFAKLLALQAKIVGGKQRRDLIQPGRLLIREGELLKVCRKQIQPRWFVLLSDSLLYLKQIQSNDILYLKYELPLDDCQVELPAAEEAGSGVVESSSAAGDQDNTGQQQRQQQEEEGRELELNICTTVRSMTLIAKSRQERDDWFEALRSAIENHVAKRRSFRSGAAATANSTDATQQQQQQQQQLVTEEALNDLIGRKAPIWTPDSRVTHCQLCTSNFSALFRRHHCRACGRVVCSACSSNKAPLIYLKCKAARVCDQCFESLRANMHLYYLPACQIDERELRRLDEHFKTLLKSQFVKRRMFSSGSDRRATTKSKVILVKGLQKSIGNKE